MPLVLLALFIGVPLVEIAVFVQVGGAIGLWPTLALVVATALAGTTMLRVQGFGVMMRAREAMDRGEVPVAQVFDGACLLAAGLLLLTPGFVTDSLGLLLFVPAVRGALKNALARRIVPHAGSVRPEGRRNEPGVIEAEYEEIDENQPGDRRR